MNEDDDWKLWRTVITPMATDLLKFALEDREEFYAADNPKEKERCARRFVAGLFAVAEAMAPDEIGEWAYGDDPSDTAPHSEHLRVLSRRLKMVTSGYDLASPIEYKYGLRAVIKEIEYLGHGDQPTALRPALRSANKSAWRIEVEHWARALEWVEFLSQSNKRKSDCRAAVADAYGIGIDNFKPWRGRVLEVLGQSALDRIDRAGKRVPLDFRFKTEEQGLKALTADGKAYRDFMNLKAGNNVHPLGGR